MLLNRFETALMNNPLRAFLQGKFEAGRLLQMGGPLGGGMALEIGCGRGVGVEVILEVFGAERVDAFDLDARMIALAKTRLATKARNVRLWKGDVTRIPARDGVYDAVFDFGIIHHVVDWRRALREVFRVLAPGGRLYAEEALRPFILNPVIRRLFEHPLTDRFDHVEFGDALQKIGFRLVAARKLVGCLGWYVAEKPI